MSEKEFWDFIERQLGGQLGQAQTFNQKFAQRLLKILLETAGDLRGAAAKDRLRLLRRLFINAGYNEYWKIVQAAFDKLLKSQNEHWAKNTKVSTTVSRSNSRLTAFEQVNFTRFGKLGDDSITALDKLFKQAAKENWSAPRLTQELSTLGGRVGQYSAAIADTALRGWDRTVTATKAEIAGIDKALYDGPALLPTSHQFCVEHYQGIYTREEIENMENGQLEPVITYCGGYQCRHRWRWQVSKILK